jgi:DNA-binding protein HU-beta
MNASDLQISGRKARVNRTELEGKIALRLGSTRAQAKTLLDAVMREIEAGVVEGGRVSLRGFGVFEATSRKPRRLLHPRSLAPIDLPARRSVRFRPSADLLHAIRDDAASTSGGTNSREE